MNVHLSGESSIIFLCTLGVLNLNVNVNFHTRNTNAKFLKGKVGNILCYTT